MSRKLILIFLCLFFFVSFALLFLFGKFEFFFLQKEKDLVSPVLFKNRTLGLNQWFPQNQPAGRSGRQGVLGVFLGSPDITAEAALFLDTKSGEILYSKNIHQRLPIASLAKVMTVLVSLEQHSLQDKFSVSAEAASFEPDKMWLIANEELTLEELLYGIFLISANDAAEVLAENSSGGRETFIKLMNSKAQQLGMRDSWFVNPTGLDEDTGSSYSTVYDLALLTRYTIRNFPEIVKLSATEHVYLPITNEHQDYEMYSGINLLTTYPGVVGFKTGYTPEAGLTLITLARREGKEVLGVLLGTENRREEARELLDYSFKKSGVSILE